MSGHSKFANIKHKKEKNDAAKGKIFTKIGRELAVAVKEGGGPDPTSNSRLRDVIAKAKSNNMPNDTIERNIKKAAGEGSGDNYEHITYEGYGPNGTAIIVRTLTDNKNRTASNVRNAFTKGSGNVGTPGCVSFMFDEKGQIIFTADLPVDGKYYVKEIFAPDGFVTTEEVQEFTFEYAGEDQAEVSYDFTFENQPTTVELSKTDLTTGKELPGAHLKVTDSDGNTVDEWTSTEESHVIKELVVGKKYTMTETKPADGYVTAESITFTVENTAEVQKHEMKDDVTKVQISKTDITGETEIPGAKLTILDKDDQVVESWTSTEEAHYIEKLPIGKYTLREEQAPKGYLLTSDVTFEVKDTGEIQKVAMKDDTAKGKVILNKTDKSSGEPLKGVEFELRDSKGKVLETLKTDAAGHAESKLYEIATFKNGKYDTAIKYYLVETKTLDGYTLDQTKHEVTFAYADDSTPVVEVTFNLTNEKPEVPETPNTPDTPQSHEETKISNAPKTGDSTNIWLPILLLVTSTGGMAGLYISRKRKSK